MRLLLPLVLSFCAVAQGPHSSPEATELTVKENKNSQGVHRDAINESKPVSLPQIKTASEQPVANQSDRNSQDKREEVEISRRLMWFTFGLVVVGLLQVGALYYQARLINRTIREMQDTTRATREAVGAYREYITVAEQSNALTRESNGITRDATELTCKAIEEAKRSNAITEAATNLTRQSLILSHRPKLIARTFFVHGFMNAFRAGSTVEGQFYIVNVGGTKAQITEVFVTALMEANLPMKRLYDGRSVCGESSSRSLGPGESMAWSFRKEDGALLESDVMEIQSPPRNSRSFDVLGFIRYTDDLDPPTPMQTGFCRRFNRSSLRFEAVEDPDYEYAD